MSDRSPIKIQGPGLVLSGGGVRGAYEAGVVSGIIEALGPQRESPFRIFAGTSVGAINATFLAANAHRSDLGVYDLRALWDLRLEKFLKFDPLGLFETPRRVSDRLRRAVGLQPPKRGFGRSLLDVGPLERLVRRGIDFEQLHHNIDNNRASALAVAALEIASGRTTIFVEHSSETTFRGSVDPRRVPRSEHISADHILGSCALPLLYPARKIGQRFYVDGGIRFNTPIAPAIRTGADRIVVVAPSSPPNKDELRDVISQHVDHTPDYPSLPFLVGKLLNALLLDPLSYDLDVLRRFNALYEVLDETLTKAEMQQVRDLLVDIRGASYRQIDTLVFRPSEDLSRMAAHYVDTELNPLTLGPFRTWVLGKATRTRVAANSDLASYLLFDGKFIRKVIALGHDDAIARADEIRTFFARPGR